MGEYERRIVILDTNILVRLARPLDPLHSVAQAAVENLTELGALLHTVPQALFELWAVATRPESSGGLGFNTAEAKAVLDYFALEFAPFPDDPAILTYWRQLVAAHKVSGRPTHDARFVAAMQALGLNSILTFNDEDFKRYVADGIVVIHPTSVPELRGE